MKMDNTLLYKIQEKEDEIKEEVSLKKKTKKDNRIVIVTSLLLFSGIIIGLIRILLRVF